MNRLGVIVFTVLGMAGMVSACAFKIDKGYRPPGAPVNTPSVDEIDKAIEEKKVVVGFDKVRTWILKPHCISCHDGPSGDGGVDLSSFAAVMSQQLVMAGNIQESRRYSVIHWAQAKVKGAVPMPDLEAELPDNLKRIVALWIEQGAQEQSQGEIELGPKNQSDPDF